MVPYISLSLPYISPASRPHLAHISQVDEIVVPREGSLRQIVAAFARETEDGATGAGAAGAAAAAAEVAGAGVEEAEAAGAAAGGGAGGGGGGAEAAGAAAGAAGAAVRAGALPPAVACTGWEMHHDFGAEPTLTLT